VKGSKMSVDLGLTQRISVDPGTLRVYVSDYKYSPSRSTQTCAMSKWMVLHDERGKWDRGVVIVIQLQTYVPQAHLRSPERTTDSVQVILVR